MTEASDHTNSVDAPVAIPDRPTQPPPNVQMTPGELWMYEQLALRFTALDDRVMSAMTEFHKTHTDLSIIKVDVESMAADVETMEANVAALRTLTVNAIDETTKNHTLRAQQDERFRNLEHAVASIKHRLGMNGDTAPPGIDLEPDSEPKPPSSGH